MTFTDWIREAPAVGRCLFRLSRASVLLLVALSGCGDDMTGFSERVPPQLRLLEIAPEPFSVIRNGGFIRVTGLPSDTTFRLFEDSDLTLEATTTTGDTEIMRVSRIWCPFREREPFFSCWQMLILLREGFVFADVRDQIAAEGGRVLPLGTFTGIVILKTPNRTQEVADRMRKWPSMSVVSNGITNAVPRTPVTLSELASMIWFDRGVPVAGNGLLEGLSGDSLSVSYMQPDGTRISHSVRIP